MGLLLLEMHKSDVMVVEQNLKGLQEVLETADYIAADYGQKYISRETKLFMVVSVLLNINCIF